MPKETRANYLAQYQAIAVGGALIGCWDVAESPFKFGNILIFYQSLFLIKQLTQAKSTVVYLCAASSRPFKSKRLTQKNLPQHIECIKRLFGLFQTVDAVKVFDDYDDYRKALNVSNAHFFPINGQIKDFDFKSYLLNEESRQLGHSLHFHRLNSDTTAKAHTILQSFASKQIITAHIRFDGSFRPERNAKLGSWLAALKIMKQQYRNTHVLLVGNDVYPDWFMTELAALDNIAFTRDMGLCIFEELPLIAASNAFLGIASGPSNSAILSDIPYLIYKHPTDAWEEKFKEVPNGRAFPFARNQQYFRIADESTSGLLSFIEELHS